MCRGRKWRGPALLDWGLGSGKQFQKERQAVGDDSRGQFTDKSGVYYAAPKWQGGFQGYNPPLNLRTGWVCGGPLVPPC
jgi:hypothetical protein